MLLKVSKINHFATDKAAPCVSMRSFSPQAAVARSRAHAPPLPFPTLDITNVIPSTLTHSWVMRYRFKAGYINLGRGWQNVVLEKENIKQKRER